MNLICENGITYKQIKDFPEFYINSDGDIFRMKPLTQRDRDGYLYSQLRKDGKGVNKLIHRLVAETFIENPENKPCVNHIDGNKHNNNINNLEWCTYSENERHSIDVLGKTGSRCKPVKMIVDNVETVFPSIREASRKTGVGSDKISKACRGKGVTAGKVYKPDGSFVRIRWEYC